MSSALKLPSKLKPYPWQKEEFKYVDAEGRQLLWDPRTGKTFEYCSGIWAQQSLGRFLVVAPKLAAITAWPDTVDDLLPHADLLDLSRGTLDERARRLSEARKRLTVAVINPEALALEPLRSAVEAWKPRGLVVDEIHYFRTPSAARSKIIKKLADRAEWRRGGSGTITPTSYANVYFPYRIVDKSVFGTNKAQFQKRYCIMDPRFYNRVLGYNNTNELQQKVLSIASVVKREKRRREPEDFEQKIILPPGARRTYDKLAKKYVLEVEEGERSTVSHRLARMNLLHQLAGGFIYTDTGAEWVHRAKLDGLLEELDPYVGTDKQVLIYYLYDEEGVEINRTLHAAGISVDSIAGMADRAREKALRSFQAGTGTQTLLMQEQMGIGIPLSRAKTCIFYSHSERHDVHKQARDRIWAQGDDPLLYVYLRSVGTADYFYKDLLIRKESDSDALLTPGAFERGVYGDV